MRAGHSGGDSGGDGRGHAVVVGGGMAGLLAARVLSDHFERVTVVERDPLPDEVAPRKGVPQGRHIHALLDGGKAVVERLFPGPVAELFADGATSGDGAENGRWFQSGDYRPRFKSGMFTTQRVTSSGRCRGFRSERKEMRIGYHRRRLADFAAGFRLAKELAEQERWPQEKLRRHQQERLDALVRHATHHSPYYRERFPGVVGSGPVELSSLPVMNKAKMMEHYDELVGIATEEGVDIDTLAGRIRAETLQADGGDEARTS